MAKKRIRVSLGKVATAKSFQSLADLIKWLESERDQWAEFADRIYSSEISRYAIKYTRTAIDDLLGSANQLLDRQGESDYDERLKSLLESIETNCIQGPFVPSHSPLGAFALKEAHREPEAGAGALAVASGFASERTSDDLAFYEGAIKALMLTEFRSVNFEAEIAALKNLADEWNEVQRGQEEAVEQFQSRAKGLLSGAEDSVQSWSSSSAEVLATFRERLEQLEHTYLQKLRIDAPVDYWSRRARNSRMAFAGWLVLLVLGSWFFGSTFLALADAAIQAQVDSTKTILQYGTLVVTGVLGLWAIRLVSRFTVGSLHMSYEAAERVTMIQTYLALEEGGKGPGDAERMVLLQTLFRPGTSGLVKEEGKADLPIDLLLRNIDRSTK